MKLLDALLGRSRPVKSQLEPLFSMATASVTLTVQLGLETTGRGGICLRPVASTRFDKSREELRDLVAGEGTRVDFQRDAHGFVWVILENPEVEDLVAAMHMVSLTLQEHGFSEQLLAAVFKFRLATGSVYWIYSYKRGNFYPLVPLSGDAHQRDNAAELRLQSLLEHELPVEAEQERWYPLWDMPV